VAMNNNSHTYTSSVVHIRHPETSDHPSAYQAPGAACR
jgi:hypothetical protein